MPKIELLRAFLTKFGKIKSRRKTRIWRKHQSNIAKCIKYARSSGYIPQTLSILSSFLPLKKKVKNF